jgi:exodeoxyribonuclease III
MFKVASWNLNSVRSRLTHVTAWLKVREPDVLLLQELKGTEFPFEAFKSLGYESVAVTQKAYNGVAILSRHPMKTIAKALVGDVRQSCAVLGGNHQGHPHRQYLCSQWQSGRE